ncbi:ATP-binding protein [Pelatocladus sp. BLCC-F211]|uniref:ATP-binding protein n=1 Tax=Pelatocladus sp. BLCC-F211 TaxID=3342752 RepID=UPI0035B6E93C
MNPSTIKINRSWDEANLHYLSAAVDMVRSRLERYTSPYPNQEELEAQQKAHQQALESPSALEQLCKLFGLSSFERDILLLCVAMEFRGDFAGLCAVAQGDAQRSYPTFSLALAVLSNPHWQAIAPHAPLRHWRLIEIGSGQALTLSPLKIDERILHYLLGTAYLDERLASMVEPLAVAEDLVPSHQILAEQIAAVWTQTSTTAMLPVVQLCGAESASKKAIAARVCEMLDLSLSVMPMQVLPSTIGDLDTFIRLWHREAILSKTALLVDCEQMDADIARTSAIARLLQSTNSFFLIASRERLRVGQHPVVSFEVGKPNFHEQNQIWQQILVQVAPELNGQVKRLVSQFNLSPATIRAACAEAAGHLYLGHKQDLGNILWDACRMQAHPRLDELAQHIPPAADWEDLVLPEPQREILREIAAHVRQRVTVYETWGFAAKNSRGLGISALFAGASGTGKTLAAEVLAQELRLDLYRIDLSSVVSKYIGETEKNLRRVFDAAEDGGAILLFDEADALFGKRSEVKDSRDRYANIEVSYLLQRMESYPGLAILTTNLKSAIDTAFLRRIRFVVQFPFPDATQREEIWRRIFPTNTPTEALDYTNLARLNVAGGNIRNIALNAAFLAADAGEAVQMKHLLRAAQTEYGKLEKSLTEAEVGGWV